MLQLDDNTFQAEDWVDLQRYLFDVYEPSIDRFRSRYVYRGTANRNHGLLTSLQRIGRKPSEVEQHLIRNFQKYSPVNTLIDSYNNIWNWIALGQHYGLPTRLLDWTYSPNIALHFMTENLSTYDVDGMIWMVDFVEIRKLLPQQLKVRAAQKDLLSFTSAELRNAIGDSLDDISNFLNTYGDGLIFFEPSSIDDRIVNQFALFSFMLNPNTDKLAWLNKHPTLVKKIIIPHALKWEIRDKLDQANITERIIYPGLDGVSRWLARWYSEKNPAKRWIIS